MRKLKKFIVMLLICLMPISVNAACTSSEKARLKKIISNVNISYDYTANRYNAYFNIKVNNLTSDIYFIDSYGKTYSGDLNGEANLSNYPSGNSYSLSFYGSNSCFGEKISTLYVTTPTYNPYYLNSVCDDAKEYELCQKWASHSLNKIEFVQKVKEYKEKKGIIDDSDIKKDISYIDFTISFIKSYGIYILGIVLVIIIVIKIVRYKKDSFGF